MFASHAAGRFVFRREPTGGMPPSPDSNSVVLTLNVQVQVSWLPLNYRVQEGNMFSGGKWNLSHSASQKSGNFCLFGLLSCVSLGHFWQRLFAIFGKGFYPPSPRRLYLFLSLLCLFMSVLSSPSPRYSVFSPHLFPVLFCLLLLNPILLHLFSFIHLSVIQIPFTFSPIVSRYKILFLTGILASWSSGLLFPRLR